MRSVARVVVRATRAVRVRGGRSSFIGSTGKNVKEPFVRVVVAVTLAVATCANARADDADFAREKKCLNCHALDEKRVGPPFRSVASRYANDRNAEARLAQKIREGGSGAWGVVPMPTNDVSAAEAQRLAHWVLMQK